MATLERAEAIIDCGLSGDHKAQKASGSARQVSFISAEHLRVVASVLGQDAIDPALVRRNVVIEGINLFALRYQYFQIGEAIFQACAECHPCSRMNENLGHGGHAAMLGHGGLCAKVLRGGPFSVGDAVVKLDSPPAIDDDPNLSLFDS